MAYKGLETAEREEERNISDKYDIFHLQNLAQLISHHLGVIVAHIHTTQHEQQKCCNIYNLSSRADKRSSEAGVLYSRTPIYREGLAGKLGTGKSGSDYIIIIRYYSSHCYISNTHY